MKDHKISPTLEVIACSLNDAIEAQRGGAHRLEIVRQLELGGLTPPVEVVKQIKHAVPLPCRVMVRETSAHTVGDTDTILRLEWQAREFSSLGVEGLVLGFLTSDGQIDLHLTRRILSAAPGLKVTFHRAFDATVDPMEQIRRLKELPQVDRILTGGGGGNWNERKQRLVRYQEAAAPEIAILVGGGLTKGIIERLRFKTPLIEFHTGTAARNPPTSSGGVDRSCVRELVGVLG